MSGISWPDCLQQLVNLVVHHDFYKNRLKNVTKQQQQRSRNRWRHVSYWPTFNILNLQKQEKVFRNSHTCVREQFINFLRHRVELKYCSTLRPNTQQISKNNHHIYQISTHVTFSVDETNIAAPWKFRERSWRL